LMPHELLTLVALAPGTSRSLPSWFGWALVTVFVLVAVLMAASAVRKWRDPDYLERVAQYSASIDPERGRARARAAVPATLLPLAIALLGSSFLPARWPAGSRGPTALRVAGVVLAVLWGPSPFRSCTTTARASSSRGACELTKASTNFGRVRV